MARGLERLVSGSVLGEQTQDATDAAVRAVESKVDEIPQIAVVKTRLRIGTTNATNVKLTFGFVPDAVLACRAINLADNAWIAVDPVMEWRPDPAGKGVYITEISGIPASTNAEVTFLAVKGNG